LNGIDQPAAAGSGDRALFWRHPHFRDMGLLKARFRRHRYDLHTHPTYVVALITGGCETVRVGRRRETAPPAPSSSSTRRSVTTAKAAATMAGPTAPFTPLWH
jgi:hypothetical protein